MAPGLFLGIERGAAGKYHITSMIISRRAWCMLQVVCCACDFFQLSSAK